jgi:hypothetical protein
VRNPSFAQVCRDGIAAWAFKENTDRIAHKRRGYWQLPLYREAQVSHGCAAKRRNSGAMLNFTPEPFKKKCSPELKSKGDFCD